MRKYSRLIGLKIGAFIREENGAQVVEYALIIAVISIGLALGLSSATSNGLQGSFATLATRVVACFKGEEACLG